VSITRLADDYGAVSVPTGDERVAVMVVLGVMIEVGIFVTVAVAG
jgi:hypothetical protein